jgi:hypothetical protein
MPKAYLSFNLPEENEEFYYAQKGIVYSIAISDLDNWLRDLSKYKNRTKISIQEVRDKINELLTDMRLK